MTDVTTELLRSTAQIDEAAYAKFVAKTLKSYRRYRDHGRRGYVGWTDAECEEATGFYCRAYRHQFRVFVKVEA